MSRAPMKVPPHEAAMRREAIDPALSVFVSANAGSGKTTILTSRVIRLLLSGAPPSRILCLTYTKAAAAEMQDRVFRTLGTWVRMSDAALRAEISAMTGERVRDEALVRARALFAAAVETPGGLKIQTIHAFAERLLHLFPFEANVPARFQVLDDLARAELLDHARRASIRAAIEAPQTALGAAFLALADSISEQTFNGLIDAALPLLRRTDAGQGTPAQWRVRMAGALGLEPGADESQVAADIIACFPAGRWLEAVAGLTARGPHAPRSHDGQFLQKLSACVAASGNVARAEAVIALFSTGTGTMRKNLLTQKTRDALPWLSEAADEAVERLPGAIDRLRAIRTLERSVSLMTIADAVLTRYRAGKSDRALVDFDDMIDKALGLVRAQNGASWVLMKLDGGIDHLLIDEAQDTTPEMWEIVQALTGEFFAGAGARPEARTVFAVGDEKQSIYSFQGARPEAFARTRRHFERTIPQAAQSFRHRVLQLSFRTVSDILAAVDAVFAQPARYDGLESDAVRTVHTTARGADPGAVELWQLEEPPEKIEKDAWAEVDAPERSAPQIVLAERIAADIATRIASDLFESDGKRISAGDIMILVQRRDSFFGALIRALKRRGVTVAGADRVTLTEEIGVMDLIAAARVALLPEDDLALAEVLKSPLLGLDDNDLIALAPERSGSLFDALAGDPAYQESVTTIKTWRKLARSTTPYRFFATLLGPMGGRRRLLARLGPDAADGLDLFLANVQAREGREAPSLVGEIAAFSTLTTAVKRDQEQAGEAVRVLTVHGAKGLEARIVYLPDCQRLPIMGDGALFPVDQPDDPAARVLLWAGRKEDRPLAIARRKDEEEQLKMQEYRRLFYVAMTRAKDRLVVAGWGKPDGIGDESWYAMAQAAFGENPAHVTEARDGRGQPIRLWRTSPSQAMQMSLPEGARARAVVSLPDWALTPAPQESAAAPPIRPSQAIHAADQTVSPERNAARLRGDLVHLLLEYLPEIGPEARMEAAETLIAGSAPRLPIGARRALIDRVLGLIDEPGLAPLFGPQSRGEVALTGRIRLANGEGREVLGRIDRLAVLEDRVILADFKTGRGGTRDAAVAQLALYRALIAGIAPGLPVQALLIWTDQARIDTVRPDEMDAAIAAV